MTLAKLGHALLLNNLATEVPDTVQDMDDLGSTLKRIGFQVNSRKNLKFQVLLQSFIQ